MHLTFPQHYTLTVQTTEVILHKSMCLFNTLSSCICVHLYSDDAVIK